MRFCWISVRPSGGASQATAPIHPRYRQCFQAFYEYFPLKPEEMRKKMGSVGTPALGVDFRIIDEAGHEVETGKIGEIVGYGGGLMKRYHNQPQATKDAIWRDERGRTFLRTGDMGRFDDEG
jgi:acyl-CoA synthetase (AMP-forming)/AMP-acid ligase II